MRPRAVAAEVVLSSFNAPDTLLPLMTCEIFEILFLGAVWSEDGGGEVMPVILVEATFSIVDRSEE
jgi:hypothetical protein